MNIHRRKVYLLDVYNYEFSLSIVKIDILKRVIYRHTSWFDLREYIFPNRLSICW